MSRKVPVTLTHFAPAFSNAVAPHAKASAPIYLTGVNVYKPCSRSVGNQAGAPSRSWHRRDTQIPQHASPSRYARVCIMPMHLKTLAGNERKCLCRRNPTSHRRPSSSPSGRKED